jgi:hypothetical protein
MISWSFFPTMNRSHYTEGAYDSRYTEGACSHYTEGEGEGVGRRARDWQRALDVVGCNVSVTIAF